MNINETKQLLAEIAVIDGREISDEAVKLWAEILQMIPLDIAQEAHKQCRQDSSIRYLEPKHIYAKAMDAARKLADDERRKQADLDLAAERNKAAMSKPAPICQHKLPIVRCDHCCQWMFRYHKMKHAHLPYGDTECTAIMIEQRIPTTKVLEPLPR